PAFSPDGKWLAGGDDSKARCHNLLNGREATRWQLPLRPKQSCQTCAPPCICQMEHEGVTTRNGKKCKAVASGRWAIVRGLEDLRLMRCRRAPGDVRGPS